MIEDVMLLNEASTISFESIAQIKANYNQIDSN